MYQTDLLKQTINKFENNKKKKHFLIGFDGFVDEIIHVVDKRNNPDDYDRITHINSFAERIASGAGLSANIELVPVQTKLGGNGPIMANAILSQGHNVSYIGAIGNDTIDPVFEEFADNCRTVVSLTEPGHTDALEFYDGKIMLGKMHNLVEVSIENLLKKLPEQDLTKLLSETDMLAFTNWTMLSNLNGIIEKFGSIISDLPNKPRVFIDLADPRKRTNKDIRDVLSVLSNLPCDTILSMNLSESTIISLVLGIKEDEILPRAMQIRESTGIHGIVIHPLNGAAIAHEKESMWIEGPYTQKPKLTTGAGDNFNAGFCNAWIAGFDPGQCLLMGVCTSGFYVRNGRSPSHQELLGFMKDWLKTKCGTI